MARLQIGIHTHTTQIAGGKVVKNEKKREKRRQAPAADLNIALIRT